MVSPQKNLRPRMMRLYLESTDALIFWSSCVTCFLAEFSATIMSPFKIKQKKEEGCGLILDWFHADC